MSSENRAAADAVLDAWRERGDHRFDPVRFRFIEAMARRAAAHEGAARRRLDERLAGLLAGYGETLEQATSAKRNTVAAASAGAAIIAIDAASPARAGDARAPRDATAVATHKAPFPRGALAELADLLRAQAASRGEGVAAGTAESELPALDYFRSTWSRLSADRRLTQSLATVPENAGPLNSHQLVHRALTSMRELSPAYVHRFMTYVDALLWLEQAQAGKASSSADAPRAEGGRKSARSKGG